MTAPIKPNQSGDIENKVINKLLDMQCSFIVDERVTLTGEKHPATDNGNLPPCLFNGLTVNIDPISKNI